MNRVTLYGNLGKDPEFKSIGEYDVCEVTMATQYRTPPAKGSTEWKESTDWHRLKIWGKRGEQFAKYAKKGDRILVEGRITYRKFTDKAGNEKNMTEIIVENYYFGGAGGNSPNRTGNFGREEGEAKGPASLAPKADYNPPADPLDDDIPF